MKEEAKAGYRSYRRKTLWLRSGRALGIGEWDSSTPDEPEEGTQISGISLPNDIVEAYTGNHEAPFDRLRAGSRETALPEA